MIHLGDITKISGYDAPAVDVITGGSPCQDLSVAGKRVGLAGERSGLFMEQIRIIKEMRENDKNLGRTNEHIRPRWMVWENVCGAFSSNGGEDFRAVLEETAKVAEPTAVIPRLAEKQKWTPSGCIMGDGWSIAWRVHSAEFWGVPQRRKRISLVADFAGGGAPEVLFERKSMYGNSEPSETQREETAGTFGMGIEEPGGAISFQERAGKPGGGKGILIQNEKTGTLSTMNNQTVCYGISSYASNAMKSSNPNSGIYVADTARTLDNRGGDPACNQGGMIVLEGNGCRPSHLGDGYKESETMYTLNATEQHAVCFENHAQDSRFRPLGDTCSTLTSSLGTGGNNQPLVVEPYTSSKASYHQHFTDDGIGNTLVASDYKGPPIVCYGLDRASYNQGKNAKFGFSVEEELSPTCIAKGPNAVFSFPVVRRLTPLECERLQGYPDGWTDIGDWLDSKGKKHKGDADAPRYKALGNSIALPFWRWLLKRISATYSRTPYLGSLFDGIGGFPNCWERINGTGTARWASEIEEFPIAVTKMKFGEKNENL